ncbi:hypothetical protein RGQ29_030827 [Quercus rubra]|uniref:mitogen-activated protein kinase kinase kinase n=1 Tax=Quercus rubra TaxID=3512 RepID=A0AAN7EIV7_QUERU|nr:hypothetical protein RGQ29_030827 [Quercus rubra]
MTKTYIYYKVIGNLIKSKTATSALLLTLSLKMPSWWERNSKRNAQQGHRKQVEEARKSQASTSTNYNNKRNLNREKQKSLDEAIFFARNSKITSQELIDSSISANGFSVFRGFHSDIGSLTVEKKAYPLPQPPISANMFYSVTLSLSGSSESSSSCSSCDKCNENNGDHGEFGSFRLFEESRCKSWSRISCLESKTLTACTFPQDLLLCDTSLESPSVKLKSRRHPCHALPLPPGSPSSEKLQSKWRKGRLLGRGTFGHVYEGFNSENGQMCAIKEVRVISDDQASKECLKQLNQEIALLSQLSHPNIVQFYGSKLGREKLSVYLEYVSGASIDKLLLEYGPFEEPVIQSYTRQILSGLAYLHGRNTVHRDIKGANILIDRNGEARLIDFGMAKHTTSCSSMLSFRGSPYWMAPEVIVNMGGYGPAVDIWSLGCTVLEMATSKPPWSQYEGRMHIVSLNFACRGTPWHVLRLHNYYITPFSKIKRQESYES